MRSDRSIVYYGLLFELALAEIEAVERRLDERVILARKSKLDHYLGNFGGSEERFQLLIGLELGILGLENSHLILLEASELGALFESTAMKIRSAGFLQLPRLIMLWQPDI